MLCLTQYMHRQGQLGSFTILQDAENQLENTANIAKKTNYKQNSATQKSFGTLAEQLQNIYQERIRTVSHSVT